MSTPVLKSVKWFDILPSGSTPVTVLLDRDTKDFSHLINKHIVIDDTRVKCLSIGTFAHCPPFHAGEVIPMKVRKESR